VVNRPSNLRSGSGLLNIKNPYNSALRRGCVGPEELVAEDLYQENVIGLVLRFEALATDGAVGAVEVAWFQGLVEGAESGGNVL
jgi:hypothetical protein